MPGTISESYLSRPWTLGPNASRELVWDIQDTADEVEVQSLLAGVVPSTYLGLILEEVSAEPIEVDAANNLGIWKGYARYSLLEDTNEYTFDTGGGTTKITQSLGTVNSYARDGFSPPDFQGAIGVSEDSVEGCDVVTPNFEFSETHRLPDAAVTGDYRRTLFKMTGTMNQDLFKGLETGECLFLGASGSRRGDGYWSITYRFAGSPNLTDIAIGTITGIEKLGWDYLWIRYGDFEDDIGIALVKRPVACYVERVYQFADFSLLGIGVT